MLNATIKRRVFFGGYRSDLVSSSPLPATLNSKDILSVANQDLETLQRNHSEGTTWEVKVIWFSRGLEAELKLKAHQVLNSNPDSPITFMSH